MDDPKVRNAVLRYLDGTLTEAEAARQADVPRSKLRYYARTSGFGASSTVDSADGTERSA